MSGDHRLGRDGSRLTILYDRDCGICGVVARVLRRSDRAGRFMIVALQDAPGSADPYLVEAARSRLLADELHVVDSAGRVAAGGDAALAIIDVLPGGFVLRPWAALAPFRWIVRLGYGVFARNRGRIGRWLGLDLVCRPGILSPERGRTRS